MAWRRRETQNVVDSKPFFTPETLRPATYDPRPHHTQSHTRTHHARNRTRRLRQSGFSRLQCRPDRNCRRQHPHRHADDPVGESPLAGIYSPDHRQQADPIRDQHRPPPRPRPRKPVLRCAGHRPRPGVEEHARLRRQLLPARGRLLQARAKDPG